MKALNTFFVALIILISLALSFYTFSQSKAIEKAMELKADSVEQLQLKKEIFEIHSSLRKKDRIIENASIIVGFISSLGGILAFIGIGAGLRALIIERTEKFLKEETEKGLNELVEKRYGDLLSEFKLKQNAKVLVINEIGTKIPEIFSEILKEFPLNTTIEIEKLEDINSDYVYTFAKKFDLVILEDMVSEKRWLENPKKKLSSHLTEELINKNNDLLIEFCKKISPNSAVFYYGDGQLAKENIGNTTIEQFISYANTPSTLLQNLTNLMKLYFIGKKITL